MPVHAVKGTKGAFQWGSSGKKYSGAGAKKKAIKQGLAVAYSEAKKTGKKPKPEL